MVYVQSVRRLQSARGGTVQALPWHPPRPVRQSCNIAPILQSKNNGKTHPPLYLPSADAMKCKVGRNTGVPSSSPGSSVAPSTSALLSSSRSWRSRSSNSHASPPVSSSASTAGSIFPPSVEERNLAPSGCTSSRRRDHALSTGPSPSPSPSTPLSTVFCCPFHFAHLLKR